MQNNELIERYIHEVGEHLPKKGREDIQRELGSLLYDALEERVVARTEADEEMSAIKVLRDLGSPRQIAARYRPERYLIGPEMFPIFKVVIGIVLLLVTISFVLGQLVVELQGESPNPGDEIAAMQIDFVQTAIFTVGLTTLIFAGIERISDGTKSGGSGEWDPLTLAPSEGHNRIKRFNLIMGIFWASLFIIVFNFFPQLVGTITFDGGNTEVRPLLAPEFRVYVPWLTAYWLLGVVLRFVVLRRQQWQVSTRLVLLGQGLFGLYVLYRIWIGGPIANSPDMTETVRGLMILLILVGALDVWKQLRLLGQQAPERTADALRSRAV